MQCEAFLYEEEGRKCRASGDLVRFREFDRQAIAIFLEISCIPEAADCLEVIEAHEEAAVSPHGFIFAVGQLTLFRSLE